MRNLLFVFAALLVVAGIVSTNLWLDLREERQANTGLRTQLAEASSIPRGPAAIPLPTQVAAPGTPAVTPAAPAAAAPAVPSPVESEVAARAMSAAISAGATAAVTGSGEQDLMKDPEYRKAQLTQARLRLAQSNPGLAEALGLSEREANRLFEVMAESQLRLTAELTAMTTAAGGASANVVSEVLRRRTGAIEDPIRAELGEARYAQYQEYQRNVRPALTQVASIGSALTSAGVPLNDAQSKVLTAAMMTETQRQRQQAAVPRPNPAPGTPRSIADTLQESNERQEENNRRILQAASAHLNSAQVEVLQKQFEQQAAQRQRTLESARQLDARRILPQVPPSSTP